MRRIIFPVAVIASLVAACGSGGGSSHLGSVTSVAQVVTYLGAHGLPCTNVSPNPGVMFVREEADCTIDGQTATVDIYNDASQQGMEESSPLKSGATVNGDRWSITGITDSEAHKIQAVTGGAVQ